MLLEVTSPLTHGRRGTRSAPVALHTHILVNGRVGAGSQDQSTPSSELSRTDAVRLLLADVLVHEQSKIYAGGMPVFRRLRIG